MHVNGGPTRHDLVVGVSQNILSALDRAPNEEAWHSEFVKFCGAVRAERGTTDHPGRVLEGAFDMLRPLSIVYTHLVYRSVARRIVSARTTPGGLRIPKHLSGESSTIRGNGAEFSGDLARLLRSVLFVVGAAVNSVDPVLGTVAGRRLRDTYETQIKVLRSAAAGVWDGAFQQLRVNRREHDNSPYFENPGAVEELIAKTPRIPGHYTSPLANAVVFPTDPHYLVKSNAFGNMAIRASVLGSLRFAASEAAARTSVLTGVSAIYLSSIVDPLSADSGLSREGLAKRREAYASGLRLTENPAGRPHIEPVAASGSTHRCVGAPALEEILPSEIAVAQTDAHALRAP